MLTLDDLKNWLHRDLSLTNKLLLLMGSFDEPCQVQDIKRRGREAGFRAFEKRNVSLDLKRTSGLAIRTPAGWELTDAGKLHLRTLGVGKISPAATKVATDLREMLEKVSADETHAFLDEAVQCYELGFYRSAIVMSWLAAVHVLKNEVHKDHLAAFNAEAKKVNSRWKEAKTTDDIGLMQEYDFLDRLVGISIIGKNVKEELQQCLKRRNGCGHPSSLKLKANTVAHHLEILLLNVFQRFC